MINKPTLIEIEGHQSILVADVGEDELAWFVSRDGSGFGTEMEEQFGGENFRNLKHYRIRGDKIHLVEDGEECFASPPGGLALINALCEEVS